MASIPAWRANLAILAFVSTFLLSSCSDPASVGLELAPGNNQIGVFYEEFNLDAKLVWLDSFNTTNPGVLVVGNEADPFFGKTASTGHTRLYIDVTRDRPRTDAILDSMFFLLDVVSVNGSTLNKPKRYTLHRLTEPILDTMYYNFSKVDFEANPIANLEFAFKDVKDSVLKMKVNPEFQEELFSKMKRGNEFENLISFRRYLPGVAIKATEGDNATIGISAPSSNTGFAVFYHYKGDTVATRYNITTLSSRGFNGIKSDRSGTPTEQVVEYQKSYDVGPQVGMKSTLGMVVRVDTSPFDEFLDTLKGVTFNQIDFVVGDIVPQDSTNNPISSLIMKFVDESNRTIISTLPQGGELAVIADKVPQVFTDENGEEVPNNSPLAAAELKYDQKQKLYITGITSHVNAIYRGQLQRQNWMLYAATPRTGEDLKRSMRQFVVDKNKVKVRVLYSKTR